MFLPHGHGAPGEYRRGVTGERESAGIAVFGEVARIQRRGFEERVQRAAAWGVADRLLRTKAAPAEGPEVAPVRDRQLASWLGKIHELDPEGLAKAG